MMDRRTFLRLAGTGLAGLAFAATDSSGSAQSSVQIQGLVAGQRATVDTDILNLRGGAGPDEPLVGSLTGGTSVDLLASSPTGAWWRVAADSRVGWVSAQYLEPTGVGSSSDMFDVDLVFPYARQLTSVWCDPADIEMWMAYHGWAGDVPNKDRQQALWDWETGHNAGFTVDEWNCSPFAVASAAARWMPDLTFDHFRYDDGVEGTRVLAWLLANSSYREPSIAMIWQGAHYVLVRGVRADRDPGIDPTNANIHGLYIADPNRADRRWYGSDRYIPMTLWLAELMTPASYLTPHTGVPGDIWQGRYVTIQRAWSANGPTDAGQINAGPTSYS